MKKLIALPLVVLMAGAGLTAAPAMGEVEKKTELLALDGKSLDSMQLRYDFDATWVVDNQNLLYRDDRRDYYLVTLKEACKQLEIRSKRFDFQPAWVWQVHASRSYKVQPEVGSSCDVARIAQIEDDRADALRDSAQWRIW